MLDLFSLSTVDCGGGIVATPGTDGCGGGIVAPTGTDSNGMVSLADWHKTDDPWGAYLVDHHPPQGHTVYVPYGEGGPNVHACEGGTPGCYANAEGPSGLHTTALGAGPEVYNNMDAPHNCVGGSEQGCIPKNPPVADASKTGYANGEGAAMAPSKELAAPAAMSVSVQGAPDQKVATATPGHLVMGCHALTLATLQGIFKGDFSSFKEDAANNAEAVTPVGAYMVKKVTA